VNISLYNVLFEKFTLLLVYAKQTVCLRGLERDKFIYWLTKPIQYGIW